MKVYEAIALVIEDMVELGGIPKSGHNTFQKYFFRGVDQVYNALAPILAKRKLLILPRVVDVIHEARESKKNEALFFSRVLMEFDFVSAEDGSKHVVKTVGEAMDSSDKSCNKAMSAAFKYACFMTFCIPVDVVDADADHPEAKPKNSSAGKPKVDVAKPDPKPAKVWDANATAEFMNQIDSDDDVNLHAKMGELLSECEKIGRHANEMARSVVSRRVELLSTGSGGEGGLMAFEKAARLFVRKGLLTQEEFLASVNAVRSKLNKDLVTK